MKKEALSVMTVKTLLAVLLFAGMGTIIIGGGYIIWEYSKNGTANQITKPANQEVENYYDALEKKCDGDSCCLSSLEYMKENNYKEADDNGRCSEGFDRDMMACITSYHWCVPIKEKNCAKVGEFVNPDNLKGKTNYPDVCCEGLKGVNAYKVNEDGECEVITGTPYLTCVPCGNGVCDEIGLWFENKCNCPEDCGNETDTSNWKTYRNEEFGFEVKYPENWKAIENGENGGVLFFDNPFYANEYKLSEGPEFENKYRDYAFISIDRYSEGTRTAAGTVTKDTEIKDFVYKLYPKDHFVSEEIIVGDQKAYMFGYMPIVYLKQKNDIVTISMWSGSEYTDHKKLAVTFRQILSTFKFIEK